MENSASQQRAGVRQRYQEALDLFIAKVRQDRYIVAAILFGSLAYDDVWEKSDIDLLLICRDDKPARFYSIVENGINMHVDVEPRSKFRTALEKTLQGDFAHSVMARSVLLYSTDDSIKDYYQDAWHIGGKDRELQMLSAVSKMLGMLTKAEKWLVVKHDPIYSFAWILYLTNQLATIEVLWNYDVPGREVINQALKYNPAFFQAIYTDLAQKPKDEQVIREALQKVHAYLDEKEDVLFGPIFRYLAREGGTRSASEIKEYFQQWIPGFLGSLACEWLADKGVLHEVSAPLRLTEKSSVLVNEAAYYYDGGGSTGWDKPGTLP